MGFSITGISGSPYDSGGYDIFASTPPLIFREPLPAPASAPPTYNSGSDPGVLDRAAQTAQGAFESAGDFLFGIVESALPALGEVAARALVQEAGSRLEVPVTTTPVVNDAARAPTSATAALPTGQNPQNAAPSQNAGFFEGFLAGAQQAAGDAAGGIATKVAVVGAVGVGAYFLLRRR